MINRSLSPEDAVRILNELLELDRVAVSSLFSNRVNCNKALADHESVQVLTTGHPHHYVGILGLLNGLFGTKLGCITMNIEHHHCSVGIISSFEVIR